MEVFFARWRRVEDLFVGGPGRQVGEQVPDVAVGVSQFVGSRACSARSPWPAT